MRLFDLLTDSERTGELEHSNYGVVVGIVTNNQDPQNMGRVKVKFPCLSDEDESNWARIATLMAGKDRGTYFLPDVNDEVLVAFEHGDCRIPYVLGALWSGEDQDKPPQTNSDGKNNIRLIKSRNGHVIQLSDEESKETISISDKDAKNKLVIDITNNTITITANQDIVLSASQGTIKLEAKTIELKSSADTKVEAQTGVDIKANATMNLKGTTINLN
jgi:uncharacterized protein involved in type VI secretion and phage assembly